VEFALFDAQALRSARDRMGWWRNPFNTLCGGQITPASSASFFQLASPGNYRDADPSTCQGIQQSYVRHALGAFSALPNVTWELISSLDGADPIRVGFVSHFIGMLRELDPIDRLVSASVAKPKRTDAALYRMQGVDTAGFDWVDGVIAESSFAETVTTLREFGRPVVNHKVTLATDIGSRDEFERIRIWRALASGGHSVITPGTVGPTGPPAWLAELIATVDRHGAEADFTTVMAAENVSSNPRGMEI
jgi:hypothetical protein